MPNGPRPGLVRGIQAAMVRTVTQVKSAPPSPFGRAFIIQTMFEATLDNLSRAIIISPRDYGVTQVTDSAVWMYCYDLHHRSRIALHFSGLEPF